MTSPKEEQNKALPELSYETLKKILDNSHDEIYVTNAEDRNLRQQRIH